LNQVLAASGVARMEQMSSCSSAPPPETSRATYVIHADPRFFGRKEGVRECSGTPTGHKCGIQKKFCLLRLFAPQGQRILGSQVFGLEVKSSAIIPRTLINSVHYRFITDS